MYLKRFRSQQRSRRAAGRPRGARPARARAVDGDGAGARLARSDGRARSRNHRRGRSANRRPRDRKSRRTDTPTSRGAESRSRSSPRGSRPPASIDAMAAEVAASIPAAARRGASPARLRDALAVAARRTSPRPTTTMRAPKCSSARRDAGKTTTIAKIAAQERARGGQRLGLLAADGFRIGAVEQLRTYADILDAPFRVARTARRSARACSSSATARRCSSTRPADRRPTRRRKNCFESSAKRPACARTSCCRPATSVAAARRILDGYADARPTRLVLTKLDEAESLSPLVSLLHERQVPISYLGTGQRVPEDLNRATAQAAGRLRARRVRAGSVVPVMTQSKPRTHSRHDPRRHQRQGRRRQDQRRHQSGGVAGAPRPSRRHHRRRLRPRQHRRAARPHAGVSPRPRADRREDARRDHARRDRSA